MAYCDLITRSNLDVHDRKLVSVCNGTLLRRDIAAIWMTGVLCVTPDVRTRQSRCSDSGLIAAHVPPTHEKYGDHDFGPLTVKHLQETNARLSNRSSDGSGAGPHCSFHRPCRSETKRRLSARSRSVRTLCYSLMGNINYSRVWPFFTYSLFAKLHFVQSMNTNTTRRVTFDYFNLSVNYSSKKHL